VINFFLHNFGIIYIFFFILHKKEKKLQYGNYKHIVVNMHVGNYLQILLLSKIANDAVDACARATHVSQNVYDSQFVVLDKLDNLLEEK
jgi:hypothetical protein